MALTKPRTAAMPMISPGVLASLSPLEASVLTVLADGRAMKVREVHASLSRAGGRRKVVLTSVAVMLDRLHGKGLVGRKIETCRGGTRYIYSLKKPAEQIEEDYLQQRVDALIGQFGDKATAYFHKRFAGGRRQA